MTTPVDPKMAADLVRDAAGHLRPRHSGADIALGAMAGLGLLRSAVLEHAGYNAMRLLDDWLRAQIDERRSSRDLAADPPESTTLPEPGLGFQRSATILKDAVYTCFFFNPQAPGNELLLSAADALLDLVDQSLGTIPPWAIVQNALGDATIEPGGDAPRDGSMIRLQ